VSSPLPIAPAPEREPSRPRRRWLRRLRPRWLAAAALVIALVLAYRHWAGTAAPERWITAEVSRGPVVRAITTTGAVDPVITVEVGAYVSGTLISISCDYNTQVKAGQLCAKIDPRPYQVVVDQDTANLGTARAQLEKDRASLAYAKVAYERDSRLLARGVVSQDTVDNEKSVLGQATAQIELDEATIRQREAELHAAQVNLDYTNISSPVDGTVVSRNVTIGQTVAASFQTPTLFLIAQDLTKMQVDTNVSESDVGTARVGQRSTFTVEAYPGRTFTGQVSQIREAPITVQNVVTYDVVIAVDNADLALLPGMTANTRIVTAERADVLRVPLQALRFSPRSLTGDAPPPGRHEREHGRAVQVLRDDALVRVPVTVGLEDGNFAEVTSGDLKVGDQVVVDEASEGDAHHPPATGGQTGPRRFGGGGPHF
jgi:HlyD family secretion protein